MKILVIGKVIYGALTRGNVLKGKIIPNELKYEKIKYIKKKSVKWYYLISENVNELYYNYYLQFAQNRQIELILIHKGPNPNESELKSYRTFYKNY